MRIGILTQPLKANYGGILQNWALQHVLIKMGHEPITIDIHTQTPIFRYILSTMKSFVFWFIPTRRRRFVQRCNKRPALFEDFVQKHIKKTTICYRYTKHIIKDNHFDALVVGSDQTWRPLYNKNFLYDMFLSFAKDFKGKKIAYAASFGTDFWEFNRKQTRICSDLVKSFNNISVREESGVMLCEKYLGINAIPVLDPTLLVEKEAYLELCSNIPEKKEKFLAAYILDSSDEINNIINEEANKRGLSVYQFYAQDNAKLTVEEWVSVFRDANYIVTDSFHGTVFSIIFEKPFKSIQNVNRGNARFVDILQKYNSGDLTKWKAQSLAFLKESL